MMQSGLFYGRNVHAHDAGVEYARNQAAHAAIRPARELKMPIHVGIRLSVVVGPRLHAGEPRGAPFHDRRVLLEQSGLPLHGRRSPSRAMTPHHHATHQRDDRIGVTPDVHSWPPAA